MVSVRAMVCNATLNNISVMLWWSVLLLEETAVPTDLPQVTNKLYYITLYRINLTRVVQSVVTATS